MSPNTLLDKIDAVITDWHNIRITKEKAKELILQIIKEYGIQLELFK